MCLGGGDRSPRPVLFTTHPKLRPGSSGPGAAKTSGRPTTKDTPEMDIRPSHPSEDLIPAHRGPSFYPLGEAPGVSSQEPGITTAGQDCFSGESQVSVCLWDSKSQCNEPQHYLGSFRSCCIPSVSTAIIHSSTQAQLVIACHSATCCLAFEILRKRDKLPDCGGPQAGTCRLIPAHSCCHAHLSCNIKGLCCYTCSSAELL